MSRRALSRQAQAFNALLAPDDEEDPPPRGQSKGKGGRTGRKTSAGDVKIPGFKLRDAPTQAPAAASTSSNQRGTNSGTRNDLAQLVEMFSDALPREVIDDVYRACEGSLEAVMEALLSMGAPASQTTNPASRPSSSSRNHASPTKDVAHNEQCSWDWLPEECKLLILSHLSSYDLARAAGACRELAAHVRQQRQSMTCVVIPANLSAAAVRGLVASYTAAQTVDLSRCRNTLRFPNEFEDIFRAIAAGVDDRSSNVVVDSLSLARCSALQDEDVATMCSIFPTLRSLDLTRCHLIGDASLVTLSKYRRDPEIGDENDTATRAATLSSSTPSSSSGGGPARETKEVSASLQDLSLSPTLHKTLIDPLETPKESVQRIAAEKEAVATARRAAFPSSSPSPRSLGITSITLAGTSVTSKGVSEILRGASRAPSLTYLDISQCTRVTSEAIDPGPRSMLRVLRANRCPKLTSVALQLPTESLLEELSFADCTNMTELVITAPCLRDLNISGCSSLWGMALTCPRLTRLRASGCRSLLLGAAGVPFDCPALRTVSFFGCRSLDSSSFETALSSFSVLEDLDLTGCTSLGRVVATGTSNPALGLLKRLVVDGCSVLRHVAIWAPSLQYVSAKSCTRLMEVSLIGSSPRVLDFEKCTELREVALGGSGGGDGGGGGVQGKSDQDENGAECSLVLKGCDSLPREARARLIDLFEKKSSCSR